MNLKLKKSQYLAGAKKRNLVFLLDNKEFTNLILGSCFYCGGMNPSGFNGIDRFENSKGYTVENCVSCCSLCNKLKSNLHYRDWLEHLHKIIKYQGERNAIA